MLQTLFVLSSTLMPLHAAKTVLIDWSRAAEQTSPDSNANTWNSLGALGPGNDLTSSPLDTTTGTASGWSVTVNNATDGAGFGGTGINGPIGTDAPFNTTGTNRSTVDGIFSNNPAGISTITISGLQSNTIYELAMIGGRAANGADGNISITEGTGTGGSLLNNGTVLNLNITSNDTGSIAFTFIDPTATSSDSATFNAMSITEQVPEPGHLSLLALGSLSLLRRRR